MKEITITYKAEVTKVIKNVEEAGRAIDYLNEHHAEDVKTLLDADDAHISKVKYFVRDLEEDAEN